jgi:tagatose 1,6-diphosphate aldolase
MKVEFPGGDIDNRSRWEAACQRLDAACALPWVLLGAGVTSEVFLEQTAVACAAGASGVLVGRTIWGETIHLDPEARTQVLCSAGVERLNQLRQVITETGHAWSERGRADAATP